MIAIEFQVGTTTADHPVILLVSLLIAAGMVWVMLIPLLKRLASHYRSAGGLVMVTILIGLGLRAVFFGSTPIYEDDWNRYLWDGAVITQGISPYTYSPNDILTDNGETVVNLRALSFDNNDFVRRINNPSLTTIYPPAAQVVFALSAIITPFDLDSLRSLYLLSEAVAFFLMVKALAIFGRSPLWVSLYTLNPIVIFTGFNAIHMDILLVPLILATIILVRKRPIWASVVLSIATAVKLWPLILGPVLLRSHRKAFGQYMGYGLLLGLLSLVLCLPLLLSLGESSGLSAYSSQWQRSSFIFPFLENGLAILTANPERNARFVVAALVTAVSLWLGLAAKASFENLPNALLLLTLALLLLSPTGFPWYTIWFAFLIPFIPLYGAAILCMSVSLYYDDTAFTQIYLSLCSSDSQSSFFSVKQF